MKNKIPKGATTMKDWEKIIQQGMKREGLIENKADLESVLQQGYAVRLIGDDFMISTPEMETLPWPNCIYPACWLRDYNHRLKDELIRKHADRIKLITDTENNLKIGDIYRGGIVSFFYQPNTVGYNAGYTREHPGGLLTYFLQPFTSGINHNFDSILEIGKEIDKKTGFNEWRLPTDEEVIELHHMRNRLPFRSNEYLTATEVSNEKIATIIIEPEWEHVYRNSAFKKYCESLSVFFVQKF